jgi:5'-methylthioadenosine phosphorylase
MSIAIIGGTGVYDLGDAGGREAVSTPYGAVQVTRLTVEGRDVIFLARHGSDHALPPHRVNYRANIWALRAIGVREVLATQAVGSMNLDMAPGHFVTLAQFIDWTHGRPSTFFDGEQGVVVHVDMTEPYCGRMNDALARVGAFLGERMHGAGVYACTEGPRFETTAEIRMLRQFGADVVGMTNVPEVVLAREAGLCYAAICIVSNWAAGMTGVPLTHQEVLDIMAAQRENLRRLLTRYLTIRPEPGCPCATLGFAAQLPTFRV